MKPLKSDGTTTTVPAPEERIAGEELWLPPGGTAGMVVTEQTALQLPSLLAAVNTLATDVALLPLGVYQRGADGGRREAREHPADRLIRVSPDGQTTPLRWRQSWMLHALLHGNGYAEIQRTGRGAPYALHLLDPRTTCARRVDDRPGYQLDGGRWLEAANVLHLAGLGFDGLTGFNFVRLLREAIGLGMGAQSYAADYFQNGAEPGGVIETPQKLNPEGRANLRDGWHGRHGGPGNRHSVAVLEQGAKWVGTSADPEKSQLNETRKYQLLDTIRPWRLPPHKAGDFSQAHLSNIEASNLDYLMTAMMGWVAGIEQECSFKLLTIAEQAEGYYVEANTNALLRGDTSQRNASYEVALRNGWMSRNEVRRRENLDPIPADQGGDLFTVQAQNIPLDQVGKERPPKPPIAATPPALRHNKWHGKDGKFASGPGGHAGGYAAMTGTQQVEAAHEIAADLVDHPDPVGELAKEFPGTDPDTIAEAKQAHKELLKDQEVARKEQAKDQAKDLKDFDKDQAKETKEFHKGQQSEAKEFDEDQAHEIKEHAKEQASEIKDQAKQQASEVKDLEKGQESDRKELHKSTDDLNEHLDQADSHKVERADLDQQHASDQADLTASHKADTEALHEQQRSDREGFKKQQESDREDFEADQVDSRKSFLDDQEADRTALADSHREEMHDLLASHALEFIDQVEPEQ
jgi:HK97 family phage portal protein